MRRIRILEEAARIILGDLLLLEEWPCCRILLNPKAPVAGYTSIRSRSGPKNPYGLRCIARADYVYLQAYLLRSDQFSQAFATYAHELLHQYGGDSSKAFHKALTIMNRKIVTHIDKFRAYEEQWG